MRFVLFEILDLLGTAIKLLVQFWSLLIPNFRLFPQISSQVFLSLFFLSLLGFNLWFSVLSAVRTKAKETVLANVKWVERDYESVRSVLIENEVCLIFDLI